ncbi:3-dehydroquinate synthase [Tranquillimonas alkanivorans]|uniref:3-dehydroquinate synthase n=1 Tax=Tranquillimonas alkanivorans TaxID=441119 RepID=A0A1I5VUJ6_9RHOB|nr:3-dehydroquinate synthase [Tranquillimonas alkanivorans]SFQ11111.1 3-dehydroquinate synthase [Tranquillimonas alkanivorans]
MTRPEAISAPACHGTVHWQRFTVPYEYPVVFTRDVFAPGARPLAEVIARAEPRKTHRCLVFTDAGVLSAQPDLEARVRAWFDSQPRMELAAPIAIVPGGEAIKREPGQYEAVQEAIHRHGIDRHSFVVVIGGGAVLDAVGLGAAVAHRGVRLVRVPTTVLSQNDSGVGVKNAVNLKGYKNFTGTFAPPWAVVNDFDFLDHLPRRERVSGIAEAVKVALIRDGAFFAWLEQNVGRLATFEREAEEWMVRRCAELHMAQIAHGGDPFEMGSARPLDFGHWSAHKLETLSGHDVTHGEAVAIGIALDTRYSVLAGLLPEGADDRVARLLKRLGFRLFHPALVTPAADGRPVLLAGLDEFRQHLGGELTVTLLKELGTGVEVHEIDPDLVARALDWLTRQEATG